MGFLRFKLAAVAMAASLALTACSQPASSNNDKDGAAAISVVASTTVWADIASQIGGAYVIATPLIDDLAQDPHDFEPSARDELAISRADVIIENGGGYDDFLTRLATVAAPSATIITAVDAASSVSGIDPENEHIWFSLAAVTAVASSISDAFAQADPRHSDTFDANLAAFKDSLKPSIDIINSIAANFSGTSVVLTEPLAQYLAASAGLVDVTPSEFSEAIEEGIDVSPTDLRQVLTLLNDGEARVLIYNEQSITGQTQQVRAAAEANDIPVVDVTEIVPPGKTFQDWFQSIVTDLRSALEQKQQ